MLILIAESKTMTECSEAVSAGTFALHSPVMGGDADGIMESLRDVDVSELSREVKISLPLAGRLRNMIYEFPNKTAGYAAIEAFTGVVFKALDYGTFNLREREQISRSVRIVSSLYGWLRPDDIVKPYRFDFTTPLAPGGKTFASYWRDKATSCLIAEIERDNHQEVLDLLPGDASKCIDWKRVGHNAKVWKVDFREIQPGGTARTPNAGKLKKLRGLLLRQIIKDDITTATPLTTITSDHYVAADTPTAANTILLHTV